MEWFIALLVLIFLALFASLALLPATLDEVKNLNNEKTDAKSQRIAPESD